MKTLRTLLVLHALACAALAQLPTTSKAPLAIDRATKRVNEPAIKIPSGSTLTIESGATIANAGTATGFGGSFASTTLTEDVVIEGDGHQVAFTDTSGTPLQVSFLAGISTGAASDFLGNVSITGALSASGKITATGGLAASTGAVQFTGPTVLRSFGLPDSAATIITTANLSSITATGALTSGSIGSGFGSIAATAISGTTISGTAATFTTISGTGLTFTTNLLSTTAWPTPSALSATQFTGFASTALGATLMGYGDTYDVTILNRSGTTVLAVAAGTPNVTLTGALTLAGALNGTTIPTSKTLVVTTDSLAAMAATTSAQLRGVLSDETGTGAAVFATSPTFATNIIVPAGAVGAPSVTTAADPDTGLYLPGGNAGYLSANGTNVVIWSYDGSLQQFGVSASPITRSTSTGEQYFAMQATSGASMGIRLGDAGAKAYVRAGHASPSANLQEWQNSGGTALAAIAKNGAIKPASLADADAENGTIYYSTTASKLVYKDAGGTVNALY